MWISESFFFQAEDGIRDDLVTGVQTCALPICIKLVLLTDSEEMIQEVQARIQDNYVQLKLFEVETGESFSLKVDLEGYEFREHFII